MLVDIIAMVPCSNCNSNISSIEVFHRIISQKSFEQLPSPLDYSTHSLPSLRSIKFSFFFSQSCEHVWRTFTRGSKHVPSGRCLLSFHCFSEQQFLHREKRVSATNGREGTREGMKWRVRRWCKDEGKKIDQAAWLDNTSLHDQRSLDLILCSVYLCLWLVDKSSSKIFGLFDLLTWWILQQCEPWRAEAVSLFYIFWCKKSDVHF